MKKKIELSQEMLKNTDGARVLTYLTLNIMNDIDNRNHH
jgi:hypothetical protein